MNEQAGQFRSAALGGFHRQDVLDYIETLTKAHQAEKEALLADKAAAEAALEEETAARKRAENRLFLLEQQAAEATGSRQDQDTALAQLEARLAELEAERTDLKAALARKGEALDQAEAQAETVRSQAESRMEVLRRESDEQMAALRRESDSQVEALRRQVEALEPAAQSWHRIKDTAGDIEVAAHERAKRTIEEAEAQAAETRAEADRWLQSIQSRCDQLQADLRTAVQQAEARLDTARISFSLALEDVQGFQASLDKLLGTEKEEEPAQPTVQNVPSPESERKEKLLARRMRAMEYPAPIPGGGGPVRQRRI